MAEEETMDLLTASALVREAQDHARRALRVRLPPLYAVWGLAWLVGLGGMWLSVRGQQPYRGPALGAGLLLAALLVCAIVVTVVVVGRSTAGIRGNSELQQRIYGWSWLVGFAALFAIERAVASNGASHAAMGVLGAAGPLLVTGLIYVLGAALWLDRPMLALGIWLAVVAAAGAWTGPVTVLLVGALAGGGGFLLVAAVLARSGRS